MKINLQLNETKKFNKHFQFCIGSGHAPLALRKDYCEQLKFIHDTLGIKRVRFHGIFSDDMNVYRKLSDIVPVPGADRFVDINFSQIGEVYDNVLSCGMTPLVELSFLPKALAKNKEQHLMLYYGANSYISVPSDDKEYSEFIKAFIRFLLDRYGSAEVHKWLFEVWNEPDLVVFYAGSMEDYFHLYELTVKAIKEVDPLIKVGGPSTSGSKWINEFLAFVKKNNLPLDFISTHQYAGDPIGNIDGNNLELKEERKNESPFANANLLTDVKDGSILDGIRHVFVDKSEIKDIRNDSIIINSKQIKNVIGDIPLYYTEWNENATFSAYTNDTKKVSAFLIMTSLMIEDNVDGSSVWCFSDIFEELHMFNEEFHGGFGLLTHNGIPKPSYYAMQFLSSVGDQRYILPAKEGEITYAVFKNDAGIDILLTRQNMKNLKSDAIDVSIEIKDKVYDSATIKGITDVSGNPLEIYEKMGRPKYLTKAQLEEIRNKSAVIEHKLDLNCTNNCTTFKVSLNVNDTYLIRLK